MTTVVLAVISANNTTVASGGSSTSNTGVAVTRASGSEGRESSISHPNHGLVTVVKCGDPDRGTTGEVTTGEEITDTEYEKVISFT